MASNKSLVASVETNHEDQIHDCQFDFYGTKMATASSDKSIKIFESHDDKMVPISEIKAHDCAVWQVSWSHPKFGTLLASASFDTQVKIHAENQDGSWSTVHTYGGHRSSVNAVQFAPAEFGLVLACGSTDGNVSILTGDSKDASHWESNTFQAHKGGVNAISWAPAASMGDLCQEPTAGDATNQGSAMRKRLVTAGNDNQVRIWEEAEDGKWSEVQGDMNHSDWVRDVAWAPSTGLDREIIASCDHNGEVRIWTKNAATFTWESRVLSKFAFPLWHVSWSVTGNILAVSGGDNHVSLWRESPDGTWNSISEQSEVEAI